MQVVSQLYFYMTKVSLGPYLYTVQERRGYYLLSHEIIVLLNPHDRCKRQCTFVNCLQEIRCNHENQHSPVNHAPQPLVRFLVNLDLAHGRVLLDLLVDARQVSDILFRIVIGREHALDIFDFVGLSLGLGRGIRAGHDYYRFGFRFMTMR